MSFRLPFRVFFAATSNMNSFSISRYQLDCCDWLETSTGFPRRLFMLPRDHLKSTFIGNYIVWRLLMDPNSTHILISGRQSLANENALLVRDLILDHPLTGGISHPTWGELPNLRGNEEGKKWTRSEFFVPRSKTIKDPSVRVVTSKNAIGKHATDLYADDLEIPATCDTKEARAELRRHMQQFTPISPNSQIFIGTPHHQISIYPELEERNFVSYIRPWCDEQGNILWHDNPDVIQPDPDDEDYKFRKFSEEWRDWILNSGEITEGFFNSQYQLVNTSVDSTVIPADLIHKYRGEVKSYQIRMPIGMPTVTETYIEGVTTTGEKFKREIVDWATYWDTAYSHEGGDKSVFCIALKDKLDNRYIHRLRVLPEIDEVEGYGPQADVIMGMCEEYQLPDVTVEEAGASTFKQEIRRAAQRSGVAVDANSQRRKLKKSTFIHTRIEPLVRARRLYISEEAISSSEFFEELADCRLDKFGNFKLGDHDDSLDASAGALDELRADSVSLAGTKKLLPKIGMAGGPPKMVRKGTAFSRRHARHRS